MQFVTDIFHPLIDQKGHFHLGSHLRPWKYVVLVAILLTTTVPSLQKNLFFFLHFRPKEHHIFNILYDVKAAFKRNRLDQIKESDAWNQEAYR